MKRGEIYFANLDPTQGSEQRGVRPVLVVQRNEISEFTRTVVVVPFTASQVEKYRQLPSGVYVAKGVGGLREESVALCHQIRTVDRARLLNLIGELPTDVMDEIEAAMAFTLEIDLIDED
ncbi:MAG: type II toxin-antitoxin system PemK/MazF family toxin [Chloroflexi bacterium]|nr:type II toxin-antitoxin system PemK/MazF family toxin [Chloroflexota bacterium]